MYAEIEHKTQRLDIPLIRLLEERGREGGAQERVGAPNGREQEAAGAEGHHAGEEEPILGGREQRVVRSLLA